VIEVFEQLTLEPQEAEKRPLPLPFLLCAGCAERDPASDAPCAVCGADVVDGVGIPF
jgi:hypothetical protein